MKRLDLALLAVALGAAGLLAVHALPWVASTTTAFGDEVTTFTSYADAQRAAESGDDAAQDLARSLAFLHHGFLWGTLLASLGAVGYLVRPLHKPSGELLSLAGGLAALSGVFLVIGHVFFLVALGDLDDALRDAGGEAWWGVNYLAAPLAVAFIAATAAHLNRALPEALRTLEGLRGVPVLEPEPRAPAPREGDEEERAPRPERLA